MNPISENLDLQRYSVNKRAGEWKELGVELKDYFGKPCWHLFTKYDWQHFPYALKVCKQKDIRDIRYFCGIIRKMK